MKESKTTIVRNSLFSRLAAPSIKNDHSRISKIAEIEEKTDALFNSFDLKLKNKLQESCGYGTNEFKIISKIHLIESTNVNSFVDFDGIENILTILDVDLNDDVYKINRDSLTMYIKMKCLLFQITNYHDSLTKEELDSFYEQAKSILPDIIDSTAEQIGIKSTKRKAALARHNKHNEYETCLLEFCRTKNWDWNNRPSHAVKAERLKIIIKEFNTKNFCIKKKKASNRYYYYNKLTRKHLAPLPLADNLATKLRN